MGQHRPLRESRGSLPTGVRIDLVLERGARAEEGFLALRATFFAHVTSWPSLLEYASNRDGIQLLLTRDIDLQQCNWPVKHIRGYHCLPCEVSLIMQYQQLREDFFDDIVSSVTKHRQTLSMSCLEAARVLVRRNQVISPEGRPNTVEMQLGGERTAEALLLGLPRLNENARTKLEREQALAARRAKATNSRKVRSQGSREIDLEQVEVVARTPGLRLTATSAGKRGADHIVERSRKEIAEKQRRHDKSKLQAEVERSAAVQAASKQAARKRSGRR